MCVDIQPTISYAGQWQRQTMLDVSVLDLSMVAWNKTVTTVKHYHTAPVNQGLT